MDLLAIAAFKGRGAGARIVNEKAPTRDAPLQESAKYTRREDSPSETRKKAFDAAPEWKQFAIMVVVVEVTVRDGIDDVYDE